MNDFLIILWGWLGLFAHYYTVVRKNPPMGDFTTLWILSIFCGPILFIINYNYKGGDTDC